MHNAEAPHAPTRLIDYRPPDWLVPQVKLRFELEAQRTLVHATLHVVRNGAHDRPLRLDGQALELLHLAVDGAAHDHRLADEKLTIALGADAAVVETSVAIAPAANTRLMGLYASGGLLCTQCEAEGFRRITFFPDRPDVLSLYSVRLEADAAAYPVLLANGNPGATGALPDGRHFAEWDDPIPKPCYLFAAVAGDLSALSDRFTTMSGREVALNIWTAAADVARCGHAMAALKASMAWDERVYGREYDLDVFNIVAVADFNFGAMENKGLNIFNSKYVLADAETATDWDFDSIAGIVAHEYFHNWSGNRVTCRDWFQLSLKEGFTVFRDQQFSADQGSAAVKRIEDVRGLRGMQFAEDAGPLAHPVRPDSYVEISNFYTATIYNKGAEIIRMMHRLLGEARFRAASDSYFAANDGRAATVEDFLAAMAGQGLDADTFARWYRTRGTPVVAAALSHDAEAATATLTLRQSNPRAPDAAPLPIPLATALFGRQTGARLGEERLILLDQAETRVTFEAVREPPVLSINRGFSAPVLVQAAQSADDLAFLAAHDDDGFGRYEAMQQLLLNALIQSAGGGGTAGQEAVIAAVRATLRQADADPAFVAETVLLPAEALIGDRMGEVDPEAIHAAREALRRTLSGALREEWWALFHGLADTDFALTPLAKGRRRLRGVALGMLMAGDDHEATAAAFLMFADAATMTDRMAALGALANSRAVEREEALRLFEARHGADANAMDKWYAVQAASSRPDTLAAVRRLQQRADYSPANPNRLRSLVLTFANNQLRFHAADGGGYDFLTETLLAVDAINPQSAARLAAPLGRWKRFDAGRAGLMRRALERIRATPGLSKDVQEMVSNSLEG
ncbi:aminopeptidase N [Sandaracinobacteroides saxicola]|uniref:Aminopeptidase N n=1 Tax=Sandaracinobacteroides saxicola TaxID=2759707 RepID=A0A7G5II24_9SPHN|nr:aminopeptidase N [Sandaracinobacteroides saxicola]QMW23016.1 aminopeptidase N [Sandaracinobacteroides saxicola]